MTVSTNNNIRTFGTLSYGNPGSTFYYEFPPTYTLSFNSKPILADNNISVKYNRNELTVIWFVPYDIIYQWVVNDGGGTDFGQNPPSTPFGGVSPNSIDTAVQRIKAILMRPRLLLRCEYQGLGPQGGNNSYGMTVDSSNDMNFGPLPQDFKWRNIAAQRCVELTWIVAFHTPNQIIFDSTNAIFKAPCIFNELSWSRGYEIDELGLITITTSGKYSLNSYVPASSDSYRVLAGFPVPLYCQRVSQRFQHDPTSKSTTFTIVDKQFPTENALPPKCIKMDLTHEVSSSIFGGRLEGKGFYHWNNVIQGSITLPPGEPFVTAYFLFWFYAKQRLYRMQDSGVASKVVVTRREKADEKGQSTDVTNKARSIVTKISYKESLFDRTHSFRIEYLGIYDRKKLIQQSGLFTPLYNYKVNQSNSYRYWYSPQNDNDREPWHGNFPRPTAPVDPTNFATLANQWEVYRAQFGPNHPNYSLYPTSAWNVYGYTGFNEDDGPWVFFPDDQQASQIRINSAKHDINLPAWVSESDVPNNDESQANFQADYQNQDLATTYLLHENSFSIVEDLNTFQVVRQSYNAQVDSLMRSFDGGTAKPDQSNIKVGLHATKDEYASSLPTSDYVSSYNSQPITRIIMSGYAVRAGYPPTIPIAFRYKTSSLYRAGQSIVTVKQTAKGDVPIYLATWSIPYYANTSVHTNFFKDLESTGFTGALT